MNFLNYFIRKIAGYPELNQENVLNNALKQTLYNGMRSTKFLSVLGNKGCIPKFF